MHHRNPYAGVAFDIRAVFVNPDFGDIVGGPLVWNRRGFGVRGDLVVPRMRVVGHFFVWRVGFGRM